MYWSQIYTSDYPHGSVDRSFSLNKAIIYLLFNVIIQIYKTFGYWTKLYILSDPHSCEVESLWTVLCKISATLRHHKVWYSPFKGKEEMETWIHVPVHFKIMSQLKRPVGLLCAWATIWFVDGQFNFQSWFWWGNSFSINLVGIVKVT